MLKTTRANMLRKEGEAYSLFIYGYIGDGWERTHDEEGLDTSFVSARSVRIALRDVPDDSPVNVYINSNGGDVFDGAAIAAQLRRHNGHVTGYVDGGAHSAAFNILQACDTRVMHAGTAALLHNPWTIAIGNAAEMQRAAADLSAIAESIKDMISARSGGKASVEKLTELMDAETMLTPEAALGLGLIDRIEDAAESRQAAAEAQGTPNARNDAIKDFRLAFGLSGESETDGKGEHGEKPAGKGISAYFDRKGERR